MCASSRWIEDGTHETWAEVQIQRQIIILFCEKNENANVNNILLMLDMCCHAIYIYIELLSQIAAKTIFFLYVRRHQFIDMETEVNNDS